DVVAHRLDERTTGISVGRRAQACKLLRHPFGQLLLGHVEGEDLAGPGDRLAERRVALDPVPDEREHRGGSRSGEVRLDLLDVRRLPALDAVDDDEPRFTAEEAEGVAGGDRVLSRGFTRMELLGRVLTDPSP